MANTLFYVPKLEDNGAWLDYRGQFAGGYGWRYDRALTKIRYAANHHSVTNPTGNARSEVTTLYNIHRGNGWGGIGYNFVITTEEVRGKDGLMYAKVAYVGDIGSVRAHTTNARGAKGLAAGYGNEYIVAACMIGQLHIKNPTAAQIRSAYWLYRELITQEKSRMPNLAGSMSSKLTSHKDWDYTECSGRWTEYQRNAIINYKDPAKVTLTKTTYNPAKDFKITADTTLVNIPANTKYSGSKTYKKGEKIADIVEKLAYSDGKTFYRTKYARDTAKKMYGFGSSKLEEIKAPVVTTKDVTITKTIEHETKTVENAEMPKGETKVTTVGVDGVQTLVYTVIYTDGKETSRNLKSDKITKPAVAEVVEIGTKVEPTKDEEQDQRLSAIEALLKRITDFLSGIFTGFKK